MYQPSSPLQLSNDIDFTVHHLSSTPSPFGGYNSFLSPTRPLTPLFHCITPSRPYSIATDNNDDLWGDENSRDSLSQLIPLSPAALQPLEPTVVIPVVDHENNSHLSSKGTAEAPELSPSVATGNNCTMNEFVHQPYM